MPVSRMHFEEELNRIHHDVLVMGLRVAEDLRKAVEALRLREEEPAREVKADDAVINAMQVKIEDQAAVLIATQQPVAGDLRELVATIKLVDHLERVGDYAVHLAKMAIKMKDSSWPAQYEMLGGMADFGCEMIGKVTNAFLNHNTEAARECAKMDEKIDALHKELIQSTIAITQSKPELVQEAARLLKVSGFLERLGDHVTNICELVIYMVDGTHEELNG
jgi:phosphate transport system protein